MKHWSKWTEEDRKLAAAEIERLREALLPFATGGCVLLRMQEEGKRPASQDIALRRSDLVRAAAVMGRHLI